MSLILLPLLMAGCGQPARFAFFVACDQRGFVPPEFPGEDYFTGACQAMQATGPAAFLITPGDADPPEGTRTALDAVFGPQFTWYPVVGNHEGDRPEHLQYLRDCNRGGQRLPGVVRGGPPGAVETCYSFDYQQAHFVVINQYYDGQKDMVGEGDVGEALYAWLAADLAANAKPLIFVCGHEPAVVLPDMDNGRLRHLGGSLDKYPANTHRFWALLRRHNVTAYLCGHSHDASVAWLSGVWQIDAGHARGAGDKGAPSTFVRVEVEGTQVRAAVYRADENGRNYRSQRVVTLVDPD